MERGAILIIEDHSSVRKSLRSWLTATFPDHCVYEAVDGESALALVAEHRPQVVLVDLNLPGMSGVEVMRRIRLISLASQLVVVSLYDTAAHRASAMAVGAAAYVPKSDLTEKLHPILSRLLSRPPTGSGHDDGEAT